jgi:hypothetical protein
VRVNEGFAAPIPLTLALSREGRGERISVKAFNAFVLVIEIDGSQHLQGDHVQKDRRRGEFLASLGLKVFRFDSREVLKESEAVIEVIYRTMVAQLNSEIPPNPPFSKGGNNRKIVIS